MNEGGRVVRSDGLGQAGVDVERMAGGAVPGERHGLDRDTMRVEAVAVGAIQRGLAVALGEPELARARFHVVEALEPA